MEHQQELAVREDGLQLAEARRFQDRFWTVERFAWAAFIVVIVLALLGFTGAGGPFSHARKSLSAGEVTYPRVSRWQASDIMKVAFAPGGTDRRLSLSPEFSAAFRIESIQPRPQSSKLGDQGTVLTFGGNGAGTVHLFLVPVGSRVASYTITVNGDALQARTLILP